ncbi:MAG TPA: Xaa-Pro peptidase family protein [Sedimentisphaerales bacterium]|nr:Xaa-Pro peptidase family protein [Sedimentisphaerales bacterium]HNU28199.1 Xaa-Pro peptidase family protein [Sedimentisphaerales bacterium]
MSTKSGNRRVGIVRAWLRAANLDGLILTKPENVSYLTRFAGEDSWAIVTKTGLHLVTDSRYIEQAQKECVGTTILQRAGKDPIAQATGQFLRKFKGIRTLGVEKSISVGMFEVLKKNAGVPLKPVSGIVEEPRSIKDVDEAAAIMAAAAISAQAFGEILQQIRPGVTENELAGALDLEIRKLGGKNAFETIVAFGPNGSRPHHHPTQRKLKPRDTVLIDFGARYDGYCSDITRSFAFGTPTTAYRAAYAVVEKAQAAAIAVARAGAELVEVDAAARAVIRESGLPLYGHGTGHGFGLEIHEDPFLKENAQGKLQAGQILTIEPGVYLPDKLGIRIEDDILITETGCEIITSECPRMVVLQR